MTVTHGDITRAAISGAFVAQYLRSHWARHPRQAVLMAAHSRVANGREYGKMIMWRANIIHHALRLEFEFELSIHHLTYAIEH